MHAYMIIAHNQFELLELLIKKLDDERNDIFIHIDAKVKDFDFRHFKSITKYSRVIFTDKRINITWGDFTILQCEMLLLKTAFENEKQDNPYTYYHLLSGADFPIKSNDEIYSFFESSGNKEFVNYSVEEESQFAESRIKYYHLFRKKRNLLYKILAQAVLRFEKAIGVNRLKNKNIKVRKGDQWFSITSEFAHYIISKEDEINRIFKLSYCCDEVFIQTIVENSKYKNNLFMPNSEGNHLACARLIDWERGNPYVFRKEDYDMIISSPCMFARKFDLTVDSEIIEMLNENI